MTLSFSQKWPNHMGEWAGHPNYFIEKIWASLPDDMNRNTYLGYGSKHRDVFRECWDGYYATNTVFKPKLHTFREDRHNRWKPGMKIHPVINNRTPQRFQFAPEFICTGIQYIHIEHTGQGRSVRVGNNPDYSDCVPIYFEDDDNDSVHGQKEMEVLAQNDGFESADQFFAWFNGDFKGKIVHWADVRY